MVASVPEVVRVACPATGTEVSRTLRTVEPLSSGANRSGHVVVSPMDCCSGETSATRALPQGSSDSSSMYGGVRWASRSSYEYFFWYPLDVPTPTAHRNFCAIDPHR